MRVGDTASRLRRRVLPTLAAAVAVGLGVAPAVLNGFPIVYDDSNIYIALRQSPHASWPVAYAIFVWVLASPFTLGSVPLFQSALVVAVATCAFRIFTDRALLAGLALSAVLMGLTQLPWLTSWLTADWLGGCGVLALIAGWFSRDRRLATGLLAVVLFSAVASTANLFVLAGAAATLAGVRLVGVRVAHPVWKAVAATGVLLAAAGLLVVYNAAVNGRAQLAAGSSARLFAKLVDKGLAAPHLDWLCRGGDRATCRLLAEVRTYDGREQFLRGRPGRPALAERDDAWRDPTGRYGGLNAEIIRARPLAFARAVTSDAAALARELTLSDSGRDLIPHAAPDDWVARRIRENHPREAKAFYAARQQRGVLGAVFPTAFYAWVTVLSYAACAGVLVAAWIGGSRRLAALAGVVLTTLVISTFVHGGLALPIPRYTAKSSWLATFVVPVALADAPAALRKRRGASRHGGPVRASA